MDISRHVLFGKLNTTLFNALESATSFCKLRGNPHVELVHWLHQLLQGSDNDLARILRHCKADTAALDRDLTQALMALPGGAASISDFSVHLIDAVERAWVYTTLAFGDHRIRSAYLLATLIATPELRHRLLAISSQFKRVPVDDLAARMPAYIQGSPEQDTGAADGTVLQATANGFSQDMANGFAQDMATHEHDNLLGNSAQASGSFLKKFTVDLTEQARAGTLDPVVGRDLEIRSIIDILLRRRQNNPLLTGDAGVGKTAIVEGLAQALARGDVPPALHNVRLLNLDVGALLAGASMKGEFESRLRGVIEEAGRSPQPVIVFVDEIHTLVGAGGAQGTGDAANLLKPALARGALRTIGATTWSEYKKHIEKDPALTRRFQVLQVPEPDEATAIEMLRGLVTTFRTHHQVDILDEAVVAAVKFSARYIPSRQLPDKAISLLDTACARAALSLNAPPAPLDNARRRLAALDVEAELVAREQHTSAAPDKNTACAKRLAEIATAREETQAEVAALDAVWQAQRETAHALIRERERRMTSLSSKPTLAPCSPTSDQRVEQTTEQTSEQRIEQRVEQATEQAPETSPEYAPDQHPLHASTLAELERELAEKQRDHTLVHPQVTATVVAEIVADWTGIPVGRMVSDELKTVLELPQILKRRIIGQDYALHALSRRIQSARSLLTDPGKPVGVFLLAGPSGVGKTESALALAEALYGGEQNLVSVNMSEFQEAHTVSTLKGAPPGYVGYGEGGVLTEAVRRRPHCVILLDEIEKAHQDVYELFYQVFDKGWMEDGEGRYIDFKNTIILLTTNAGSERLAALSTDPELSPEPDAVKALLEDALRKVFPPAFLGRMSVIPYSPLREDSLDRLINIHLDRIRQRLWVNHQVPLTVDETLIPYCRERCMVADTGARLLIHFIEERILPEISQVWLEHMVSDQPVRAVHIGIKDDALHCTVQH